MFSCNPMFCNLCTRSSNKAIASAAVRANRRISSAKRRSSKNAMLSPRSKPHFRVSAFCLQADIPHCNTLHNKRGLNTHPCRTPAWMGKGLLLLCSPCTSPRIIYNVYFIETLWSQRVLPLQVPTANSANRAVASWTANSANALQQLGSVCSVVRHVLECTR